MSAAVHGQLGALAAPPFLLGDKLFLPEQDVCSGGTMQELRILAIFAPVTTAVCLFGWIAGSHVHGCLSDQARPGQHMAWLGCKKNVHCLAASKHIEQLASAKN